VDEKVKKLITKLDIIASEIERSRPELSLALDLISDRLERIAGVPMAVRVMYKDYKAAGGSGSLTRFLEDMAQYLTYRNINGVTVARWVRK